MKDADKKEAIDYCEPNLTTMDTKDMAFPIDYCPFCGKKLKGSIASQRRISKIAKEIKQGKAKTITLDELKKSVGLQDVTK